MDKAYIEQAAQEYATIMYHVLDDTRFNGKNTVDEFENISKDFIAGVEWLLSVQEEIATQQLLKNAKQ
jgi:lipopolysaccharide biosynthesis regulator YciM